MTIRTTDSLEFKDKGTGTVVRVHLRETSEALQQTEGEGAGLLLQEKIHVEETEGTGKYSVISSLN